ncbi:phosphotransferase family protein [Brevibacillus migulae]|uniref:phosphotransferase family protein n=1 Tax=Brevibacillus migulae TaxID=1644114 RepID=UPI00143059A5|nr:phosphotransferase [Brevibacillus migulae]
MEQIQKRILEDIIRNNFPDLDIQYMQMLGEGRMSIAMLVNEEWVFRFPKKQEAADDLEKEIKIMPKLAEWITLAIPRFEYVGKQDNGFPFVGYKMLPGELLGEDSFPSLPVIEQRMIACQIAKFINELSAFPVDIARELGVPEVDLRKKYTDMFEQAKKIIFPFFEQDMQHYITFRFQTYFDSLDNFSYSPALIHADLSPDHYVIDPKERNLTGIIDFGDL